MSEVMTGAGLDDLFTDADMEVIDMESESELPEVQTKAELGGLNLGLDFSALGALPGVVVGKTGVTVSRYPVPRIKFAKNKKDLISILSDQVIVIKTHYDPEIGSNFICFEGDCCKGDLARVRYVYPVLKYSTDEKGRPISKEYSFGALCVGQDSYEAIQSIQEMKGSLTQYDILVTCADEQYQKVTFTEAGNARWTKIDGAKEHVQKFWKDNMKHILKGVARSITPEQYAEIKGTSALSFKSDDVDLDELFK